MEKKRFNGLSFDLDLGVSALRVQKFSLEITDNTKVAKRNGRPDGYLPGDVEASGEITVDRDGLRALREAAQSAGSWRDMETFDISSFAECAGDELKIEAFGCKFRLNKILDIDKNSTDETVFTFPFDVTSPHFVSIDAVPYLEKYNEE